MSTVRTKCCLHPRNVSRTKPPNVMNVAYDVRDDTLSVCCEVHKNRFDEPCNNLG